jgi:hypothetical protein
MLKPSRTITVYSFILGCTTNQQVDLVFVLDTSSSLTADDFTRSKRFISEVKLLFTVDINWYIFFMYQNLKTPFYDKYSSSQLRPAETKYVLKNVLKNVVIPRDFCTNYCIIAPVLSAECQIVSSDCWCRLPRSFKWTGL